MTLAPQRPRRRARTAEPTPYDFRRPIQLSREHQRTLQLGFDGFARQATTVFTSSLRTVCTVALVGIEQRTYAEYVDSLGPSTYMTLFTADPIPGTGVLEIPLFATMSCLDHMLGGPGSDEQPDRPLTEIEDGVISGLVERLLGEMRYSLEGLVALEPTITGIEYSPQFAQVAAAADVMVVVSLELRIGERAHRMSVCLPFSGLLPHLANASGSGAMSDRERAQRAESGTAPARAVQPRAGLGRGPLPSDHPRPRRARRARARLGRPTQPPGVRTARRLRRRRRRRRHHVRPRHPRSPRPAPGRPHRHHARGDPMTDAPAFNGSAPEALAEAVAEAAAAVLPSVSPLVLGPVQPGSPHVTAAFAGGAVAGLDGGVPGVVAVLVGRELVDALASSPLGGLDVAAAVQPALDAAAHRLGARARAATTLDLDADGFDVTGLLGGEFSTVPLIGTGIAGAVLVPATTLAGARAPITEDPQAADAVASAAAAAVVDEPFVPAFGAAPSPVVPRGLELLHGVDMEVTVELGRTRMTVRDLLALTPGAVLELDRAAGSPADLLVNGRLVARGEVVVVDEDFGLRVTEILDAAATA